MDANSKFLSTRKRREISLLLDIRAVYFLGIPFNYPFNSLFPGGERAWGRINWARRRADARYGVRDTYEYERTEWLQLQVYKRKERPVQRFQLSAIWLPPQLGLIVVILERPVQRFRFVLERGMRARARGCDCEKKKKERSGRYIYIYIWSRKGGRKYWGEEDGGASKEGERDRERKRERTRGTTPKWGPECSKTAYIRDYIPIPAACTRNDNYLPLSLSPPQFLPRPLSTRIVSFLPSTITRFIRTIRFLRLSRFAVEPVITFLGIIG